MCRPEECPLQEICDKRVESASDFFGAQQEDTQARSGAQIPRVERDEAEEESPLVTLGILRVMPGNLGDEAPTYDINGEAIDQVCEWIQCSGPIDKRKYGIIGRIVTRECGSEGRKERLAEHPERKPTVDGSSNTRYESR